MSITVILTTTVHVDSNSSFQVDKNERVSQYIKSIKKWLLYTNFNVVVVENSNYYFEELQNEQELYKHRFEICTYNETPTGEMHLNSKGGLEISSIHHAYNNSKLIQNSIFIIKITGRFFIPQFEQFINNINVNKYDCLKQNYNNRCEIVGSHIKNFDIIFNKNLFVNNGIYNYHIEDVYDFRMSRFKNVIVCPIFNIEKTQRGGLNECYTSL